MEKERKVRSKSGTRNLGYSTSRLGLSAHGQAWVGVRQKGTERGFHSINICVSNLSGVISVWHKLMNNIKKGESLDNNYAYIERSWGYATLRKLPLMSLLKL